MQTTFLAQQFVPLMFIGLFVLLLTGFPVAFGLAATGLAFGFIGIAADIFPSAMFQALPLRIFGIMQNDTLLAIPFFTFMGIILERSGMAEDLLETVGQVFGPVRGGVAIAVILVGALLAATTGVVAAAVISMGLISLPVMLRYGYDRSIATGAITASGTLAQAIPHFVHCGGGHRQTRDDTCPAPRSPALQRRQRQLRPQVIGRVGVGVCGCGLHLGAIPRPTHDRLVAAHHRIAW